MNTEECEVKKGNKFLVNYCKSKEIFERII